MFGAISEIRITESKIMDYTDAKVRQERMTSEQRSQVPRPPPMCQPAGLRPAPPPAYLPKTINTSNHASILLHGGYGCNHLTINFYTKFWVHSMH